MDIRVLRYFLMVAQEESFSRAAERLFLSQPTLSRQIHELETELGVTLLKRTNRNVILTSDGQRLRKRAQEIVELADKTRQEFAVPTGEVAGDIYIGGGETHVMRYIAQTAVALRREYPDIRFHLHSGNADDVFERLDKGLLNFGVVIEPTDLLKYDFLRLPGRDTWGLLMRRDHPLAQKSFITPTDLRNTQLLISRQSQVLQIFRLAWSKHRPPSDRRHVQSAVQRRCHGGTGAGLRAGAGSSGRHDGRSASVLPSALAHKSGRAESGLQKAAGFFARCGSLSSNSQSGLRSGFLTCRGPLFVILRFTPDTPFPRAPDRARAPERAGP